MRFKLLSTTCLGLSAALLCAPAIAQAQSDDAATASVDEQNPDIVVTATKRSESLRDVPMSITAVSGDDLDRRGISSVQDLVKITPGLSFVESGNSVPVFSLRGIGFYDTGIGARPTVSVYVDQAPLPFSIMAQGAAFDLERVEVLKGPQGTLFGQNATGGAINYIAAKPKADFGGGGSLSLARFGQVDVQGHLTGALSPTMNARIAVRSVTGGAWQRSYTRDDTLGAQRFHQARFLLDWSPSDRLTVSLNANGFIDKGDTQAGQLISIIPTSPSQVSRIPLLTAYPLAPAESRAADWDANTQFHRDNAFYQLALRADYDVSDDITLTSLTSWSRMQVQQWADGDATALTSMTVGVKGSVSSLSEELRLAGTSGPVQWILGGSYARDRSYERQTNIFPYASSTTAFLPWGLFNQSYPYAEQDFSTKAVFGNVDVKLAPRVTVHGGLRYTQADLDYTACTRVGNDETGRALSGLFNNIRAGRGLAPIPTLIEGQCQTLDPNLNPGPRVGSFDQDNLSWRVGLDFKPSSRALIYANVSRGYKAGSVPVLGATSQAQSNPVNQESVLAYEAGFKVATADRRVDLSGAVFYYDYTDKQLKGRTVTQPNVLGALETLVNVPKSRVAGAEAQLTVRPVDGLSVTAAATYLDTKITGPFTNYTILAQLEDLQGRAFPFTPKWQLVLDGEYRTPISANLSASLGANYNYRTKTVSGFGTDPRLTIGDYGLLDLRAGIEATDGSWRLQVFGRNVTDQYYWTNVAKYNDVLRRLAGNPATYGVQFGFNF